MIHTHSLGRAARYHAGGTALVSGAMRSTFQELYARVGGIAAALTQHGFGAGDRLALLLPNETGYLELIYACAWLGVTAVPLNTRFSTPEIDRVLADATPHGLIRHSSLPAPTLRLAWERVLDVEPLGARLVRDPQHHVIEAEGLEHERYCPPVRAKAHLVQRVSPKRGIERHRPAG